MIIRNFHICRILHKRVTEPIPKWWSNSTVEELENYGLSKKELLKFGGKLTSDYEHLKHSIEILREAGISVTADKLANFKEIFASRTIFQLEEQKLILPDVTSRFLSSFEKFPFKKNLKMPSFVGIAKVYRPILQYHRKFNNEMETKNDWPNDVELEEERTLQNEQRRVLRQYYAWRFGSDLFTVDMHMYNYSKITGLRCLKSIKQTIDILTKELELKTSCILTNFYLLSITPNRLKHLIANVDAIGEFSLKDAVRISPKVVAKSSSDIHEISDILKEYNIRDNSSKHRVLILTFTPRTVRKRLEAIAKGDLAPFLKHPRICYLIYYYNKASVRMEQVNKSGFKFVSLNILSGSEASFQRFFLNGIDHTRHFSDICNYLAGELEVDKDHVSTLLHLHPSHRTVTLHDVRETLEYIFSKNFAIDVLLESIHIVLYPKEKIMKTLEYIAVDEKLQDLGFRNGFVEENSTKYPNATKFNDKRLILCIYFLEKPYHFTGEGTTRTD